MLNVPTPMSEGPCQEALVVSSQQHAVEGGSTEDVEMTPAEELGVGVAKENLAPLQQEAAAQVSELSSQPHQPSCGMQLDKEKLLAEKKAQKEQAKVMQSRHTKSERLFLSPN